MSNEQGVDADLGEMSLQIAAIEHTLRHSTSPKEILAAGEDLLRLSPLARETADTAFIRKFIGALELSARRVEDIKSGAPDADTRRGLVRFHQELMEGGSSGNARERLTPAPPGPSGAPANDPPPIGSAARERLLYDLVGVLARSHAREIFDGPSPEGVVAADDAAAFAPPLAPKEEPR